MSGRRRYTGGPIGLLYVILAAVSSVLALAKTGVTRQSIWFAVIFLFSSFLLGPLVILPFSLLTHDEPRKTAQGLDEPENKDLRDYPAPRPA